MYFFRTPFKICSDPYCSLEGRNPTVHNPWNRKEGKVCHYCTHNRYLCTGHDSWWKVQNASYIIDSVWIATKIGWFKIGCFVHTCQSGTRQIALWKIWFCDNQTSHNFEVEVILAEKLKTEHVQEHLFCNVHPSLIFSFDKARVWNWKRNW